MQYFPIDRPEFVPNFGVRPLRPPQTFYEFTALRESQLSLKQRLIDEHPKRYLAVGSGAAAAIERWAGWTADQLGIELPDIEATSATRGWDRLIDVGTRLQEDVVLLDGDVTTGFAVIAGLVCFPSGWSIREKMGQGMDSVHRPVAGYSEKLARPTARLMAGMAAERPVWRMNWGLRASDALDQSPPYEPELARREGLVDGSNASQRLWFRVERQTLIKLSGEADVIVFAIHTHQTRMGDLRAEQKRLLLDNLSSMPEASVRYKRLHRIMEPAVESLRRDLGERHRG